MKVSVLIPTFRRAIYLKACLEALLRQQRLPDEIIVITVKEDEETHLTIEKVKKDNVRGDLIKELTISKPNIVYAENQGLIAAIGEIICLIDDDAIAPEGWIADISRHYESNALIGALGGPVVPLINNKPVIEYTRIFSRLTWIGRRITNTTKIPLKLQEVDLLRGANMSFRRKLIGSVDENLLPYWRRFEDDLCLSIKEQGYKILCDPALAVQHFQATAIAGERIDETPQTIIGLHHNSVYVKLKHFKGSRKILAFLFEFIWGDQTSPGLLQFIGYAIKHIEPRKIYVGLYAFIGKIRGVLTYLKWNFQRIK